MWSVFQCGKLSVVHHKDGILVQLPVTREPPCKALGKHEDVVATGGVIPIGKLADDDLHGFSEMAADARDIVWLMGDEVARGVDGNIEQVGETWVGDADGGLEEMTMNVNFSGVEVGVAAGVADGTGALDAL